MHQIKIIALEFETKWIFHFLLTYLGVRMDLTFTSQATAWPLLSVYCQLFYTNVKTFG